jgi:hypothetical protein
MISFPLGENLSGAAVCHASKGEDDGVEGEIAAWAVADLVVGNRVEVLVDQPGWIVVLLWETGGAGDFASKGDKREVILGIG